jgi:hypothetical protein
MGFLDKVKQFAGGKSMATVTIPTIERQASETATFPVGDSVLKGTMVIEAHQTCTLLQLKFEVWLYVSVNAGDAGSPNLVVAEKYPDPNTSYTADFMKMPYDMTVGEVFTHPWMVSEIDLPGLLAKHGYAAPHDALGDPRVRLAVKCIADVKGSPFDPLAEVNVALAG